MAITDKKFKTPEKNLAQDKPQGRKDMNTGYIKYLVKKYAKNCCETCPCPNHYVFDPVVISVTTQRYICDIGQYSRISGTLDYNGNAGTFAIYADSDGDIITSPTTTTFESSNYIQFGNVQMTILEGKITRDSLSITICGELDEFFNNNTFPLTLNVKECYITTNIVGATVSLTHISTGHTYSGTTDASGNFSFNGPIGSYNVTASAGTFISDSFTVLYTTVDTTENICLVQLNDKVIHVRNCGYLIAIPGATVTATHVDTGTIYTGTTDGSGDFLFTGAPDGNYHIVITSPGYPTYDVFFIFSNNTTSGVIYNATLCPTNPAYIRIQGCSAYAGPSYGFAAHYVSGPTNFGTVFVQSFSSQINIQYLLPGTYVMDVYSALYPLTPTQTFTITVVAGDFINATPGNGYPCPDFDPFGSFIIFCDNYTVAASTLTYVSGPTFIPAIGPQSYGFTIYNGSGTQPAFGTYQFTISAPGYQPQTVSVDYTYLSGGSSYEICLIPTLDPGGLTIGCDSYGGSGIDYTLTYVSGPTAFAPVTGDSGAGVNVSPINGGIYMVLVQSAGFTDQTVEVVVPGGTTTIITNLCLDPI